MIEIERRVGSFGYRVWRRVVPGQRNYLGMVLEGPHDCWYAVPTDDMVVYVCTTEEKARGFITDPSSVPTWIKSRAAEHHDMEVL